MVRSKAHWFLSNMETYKFYFFRQNAHLESDYASFRQSNGLLFENTQYCSAIDQRNSCYEN
jgi:hypothetical protein